jgi:signal transduction histidine kinase
VLDLAKIEAGRFDLREETIDFAGVAADCVRLVTERAERGGLKLVNHATKPLHLRGDPMALKKILTNLLSNAVKFTPPGGQVTIESGITSQGEFVSSVSDTGVGMAPEDIPRALEPFGQIDSALTRRHQGTGLGLPLAVSMSERMGGRLSIDSHRGRGTTVTVYLPAERVLRPAA